MWNEKIFNVVKTILLKSRNKACHKAYLYVIMYELLNWDTR